MSHLIKTKDELQVMRKSGQVTALILKKLIAAVKPGVNLLDLEALANRELEILKARASFKSVPGYHFATCLNVNSEVVHGLPRNIILKSGDILKIDFGAEVDGWHTDAAWTVMVAGSTKTDNSKFLTRGEEAMWAGIKQAQAGNKIGDISCALQEVIENAGYNVVRSLCGHGVGRSGHEDPEVPTFGEKNTGLELQSGMTLAIEAIYTAGSGRVVTIEDGWTISSEDQSLAGLFEMTVIVGDSPEVLTDWRRRDNFGL